MYLGTRMCVLHACGGWHPERGRRQRLEVLRFHQGAHLLHEPPKVHFALHVSPYVPQKYF